MTDIFEYIGINQYIYLSVILFGLGILGLLLRRGTIVMLMSVELLFAAADLLIATFSAWYQDVHGQAFVIFAMAVAAAEIAVGLAILVAIYRNVGSIDINALKNLKG